MACSDVNMDLIDNTALISVMLVIMNASIIIAVSHPVVFIHKGYYVSENILYRNVSA